MGKLTIKNNDNTEFTVEHSDNLNAKAISTRDIAIAVDTINDFPTNPNDGDVVIVRDPDRGGIFIYNSSKVDEHNDGTNFNGFVRHFSGPINVKWFGAKEGINVDNTDVFKYIFNVGGKYTLANGIYNLPNNMYINNDIELYDGGFTTENIENIGILLKLKYSGKFENITFESRDTNFTVIEESNIGDFIWFDNVNVDRDIELTVNNCIFKNAKNDSISTGDYTGTCNNVTNIIITNCKFYKSQRYDITIRNCNNSICLNNYSQQSGAFVDYEPNGDTNKMLKVNVSDNIIKDCYYNAIQISAANIIARGEAVINSNLIEINNSYNPSIALKQAISVRTNKASICNNIMKGSYDRFIDVNNTTLITINGNIGLISNGSGEHYEYIRLNTSVAAIGNNIFKSEFDLQNDEITSDSNSTYTSIDTNSKVINIGNTYEQEVRVNGNNGLLSRAFLKIGDGIIDTTGASGSEYFTINSNVLNDIILTQNNSKLTIGSKTDIDIGGKYEQKINILGDNKTLGNRCFLNGGVFTLDMQPTTVWFINNTKQFMGHDGDYFRLFDLPTADPSVDGALWNDSGTVKISAG